MSYFLPDGYVERLGAVQDPVHEALIKDEWQDSVYTTALNVADDHGLMTVLDIGCGSAYKLMKYFGDRYHRTLGIDIQVTVDRLRKLYPAREWIAAQAFDPTESRGEFDLVICSDVIEHVDDPDQLLAMIKVVNPRYAIISTPDRNLIKWSNGRTSLNGPPMNPCHVREWSYGEFDRYMHSVFGDGVESHFVSNMAQGTQCCVVKIRS